MFKINDDMTIECTRGDAATFTVGANVSGAPYTFRKGDVVRFSVCTKKNYSDVVLQKNIVVASATEAVEIHLEGKDTKFGEDINKATEFWYEVELNPDTYPQTIIGHTADGARVFMLYPEGIKE